MEHQIDPSRIHHSWDNRLEPTLRVCTGDVVDCDILMAGHGEPCRWRPWGRRSAAPHGSASSR
jgi:hypothetical protein